MSGRIDTHHHMVPAVYASWLHDQGPRAGGLPIPDWSVEGSLAVMDGAGIEVAILSVSTSGVHLGDDGEARGMARLVNETAAEAVQEPLALGHSMHGQDPQLFTDTVVDWSSKVLAEAPSP